MKKFLLGSLKITLGLFGVYVLIAVTVLAYNHLEEKKVARADAELGAVTRRLKDWPQRDLKGSKVHLQTKWRDSTLRYVFQIDGDTRPDVEAITFILLDHDDFALHSEKVPIANFVAIVGDDDKPSGFRAEGSLSNSYPASFSEEAYRTAVEWMIGWQETESDWSPTQRAFR